MKKYNLILIIIAMVLVAGVVTISIIKDRIVNHQWWTVSVNGRGVVAYQPDIAVITLGVQIDKAKDAVTALEQLNTKISAIIKALNELETTESDIQTQSYSLYPQYEYINQKSTLMGYNANQQIIIKVYNINQDIEMASKIIEIATKAGANQIAGVTFDVSNLEDLKQEARIQALKDAQQKASSIAQAAGVSFEKKVGWWENFIQVPGSSNQPGYYSPMSYGGEGGYGGGGSSYVPSGAQEIIVETGVNYLLK